MLLILSLLSQTLSSNMNGDIYGISNPDQNSKTQFSTVYSNINSKYEYFDVYSPPISTRSLHPHSLCMSLGTRAPCYLF